jgi:hypothetical protein
MLSHGGSRLNASKPEANPKTRCPRKRNTKNSRARKKERESDSTLYTSLGAHAKRVSPLFAVRGAERAKGARSHTKKRCARVLDERLLSLQKEGRAERDSDFYYYDENEPRAVRKRPARPIAQCKKK